VLRCCFTGVVHAFKSVFLPSRGRLSRGCCWSFSASLLSYSSSPLPSSSWSSSMLPLARWVAEGRLKKSSDIKQLQHIEIAGSARFLCALRKEDFIAPVRKDEEKESVTSRRHVVHAVLVSGEPPEGLNKDCSQISVFAPSMRWLSAGLQ